MSEQAHNLVELYQRSCEKYTSQPLFGTKVNGSWSWMTYGELGQLVDRVRGGLAALGIGPGDRVAMIADNRVEWAAAAYATYGLEAAFVPMYQAQRPSDWKFILADCDAKVAIVATDHIYDELQNLRSELPKLTRVISLDRADTDPHSFAALVAAGAAHPVPARHPARETVAGFIYTSGTTGKPKGAMLSHGNVATNIAAIHGLFPIVPEDRTLSFLPWAHSFGQTCELHMVVSFGASLAINDELPKLLENLGEVKPTILIAVPRIFNKIYASVMQQIATRPKFLQKVIHAGMQGALKRAHGEHLGLFERLELAFDDKLVFSKVRERFGGRLRFVISGSATLGKEVAELIDALGLPVYEGYGLTETSPIVTANCPGNRRMGSVGRVIPGVRVVIDTTQGTDGKEGEIVVYGPNVMLGYHHRPDEDARALSADGGLRTGDLGYLDDDGYLFISGRIKEQYKLENGKYVMPSPLEEELKMSPYISNLMLYGDGKPFNVALIVLNEPAVRDWAAARVGGGPSYPPGAAGGRTLAAEELKRLAGEFKGYEKPREFALVREDFTLDNGLLTPTMKLRRRDVLSRHGAIIAELYTRQRNAAA